MKWTQNTYHAAYIVFMVFPFYGCVEEFQVEFEDFESVLVIEATITDQMALQEVLLTRTYEFEAEETAKESGAQIFVIGSDGNRYAFIEAEEGRYVSDQTFAATADVEYHLSVETKDGRTYGSGTKVLPNLAQVDDVSARRFTNDLGVNGMGIFLDAKTPGATSSYYRFEYDETYKIIAPEWAPIELEVIEGNNPRIIKTVRSLDEKTCYATRSSNRIILEDTEGLDGNEIKNKLIRFIPSDDFILSHRYSILVRQYSQSVETYNFYETLNTFSTSENLFSENQPGFLEGNVFSETDRNEKVVGYFDVSTVDEKRIFFNYTDFYPDEPLPPYVDPCRYGVPTIGLIDLVRWDIAKYVADNGPDFDLGPGPYVMVPQVCGDCTALGESQPPEFWIE